MSKKYKQLQEDIANEQKHIEETLRCIKQIRATLPPDKDDHATEPALGTYLMNFYNGIENILKRICKVYYETFPAGANWHKELLDMSYMPPEEKGAIFSKEIVVRLYQYKNFRHRFVSGYGFQLKAEKMMELVNEVEAVWKDAQKALNSFLEKLS